MAQGKQNIGQFFVSTEHVDNYKEFARVLSALDFVPLRVEYRYDMQKFDYIGISSKFTAVEQGGVIPLYQVQIRGVRNKGTSQFKLALVGVEQVPRP